MDFSFILFLSYKHLGDLNPFNTDYSNYEYNTRVVARNISNSATPASIQSRFMSTPICIYCSNISVYLCFEIPTTHVLPPTAMQQGTSRLFHLRFQMASHNEHLEIRDADPSAQQFHTNAAKLLLSPIQGSRYCLAMDR
jgi:hypothetical protein